MQPSYVLGSSRQLCDLCDVERQALDAADWVFVCNCFPSRWEAAGFRPTVWVFGDLESPAHVDRWDLELAAVVGDPLLAERLRQLWACDQYHRRYAHQTASRWGLDIQWYRRGDPWRGRQTPAQSLAQPIYHYGSTLTDLCNLAWLLNPGGEIRVFGNRYLGSPEHFWQPAGSVRQTPAQALFFRSVSDAMWRGLSDLRAAGLPIVDCNADHVAALPGETPIPRGQLVD